eukprot:3662653-Rhodomonas_salina.1
MVFAGADDAGDDVAVADVEAVEVTVRGSAGIEVARVVLGVADDDVTVARPTEDTATACDVTASGNAGDDTASETVGVDAMAAVMELDVEVAVGACTVKDDEGDVLHAEDCAVMVSAGVAVDDEADVSLTARVVVDGSDTW